MGLFGLVTRKKYERELSEKDDEIKHLQEEKQVLVLAKENLEAKLTPEIQAIIDLEGHKKWLEATIEEYNGNIRKKSNEFANLDFQIKEAEEHLFSLNNKLDLLSYGVYEPVYVFANATRYKDELANIREKQKQMIKGDTAVVAPAISLDTKEIKKAKKGIKKILLNAFNTKCDSIIASAKVSTRERDIKAIRTLADSLDKTVAFSNMLINIDYIELKIDELYLAIDYAEQKAKEQERIRELKAQEKEAQKAQQEINEAKKKLEKEQAHYANALRSLYEQMMKTPESNRNPDLLVKKTELEEKLAETETAVEEVVMRQANVKAGYVYVISNIGAFGENVYKIGMTRRLDPWERIRELGNASVPFGFDVHAMIFTEDAPALENALHKAFEEEKINKVNARKEFFRLSLDDVKRVVEENYDNTVEWTDFPEAYQYRQSLAMAETEGA